MDGQQSSTDVDMLDAGQSMVDDAKPPSEEERRDSTMVDDLFGDSLLHPRVAALRQEEGEIDHSSPVAADGQAQSEGSEYATGAAIDPAIAATGNGLPLRPGLSAGTGDGAQTDATQASNEGQKAHASVGGSQQVAGSAVDPPTLVTVNGLPSQSEVTDSTGQDVHTESMQGLSDSAAAVVVDGQTSMSLDSADQATELAPDVSPPAPGTEPQLSADEKMPTPLAEGPGYPMTEPIPAVGPDADAKLMPPPPVPKDTKRKRGGGRRASQPSTARGPTSLTSAEQDQVSHLSALQPDTSRARATAQPPVDPFVTSRLGSVLGMMLRAGHADVGHLAQFMVNLCGAERYTESLQYYVAPPLPPVDLPLARQFLLEAVEVLQLTGDAKAAGYLECFTNRTAFQ